jgi:hypothetical protein
MKNMMVLLVMFILGGQVMGQVIPVEYQKQEVFLHRYMDACPASITTIKPYQEIEMTAKEIVIYNQVKDDYQQLYVQGVIVNDKLGTVIIYTFKDSKGNHKVYFKEMKEW